MPEDALRGVVAAVLAGGAIITIFLMEEVFPRSFYGVENGVCHADGVEGLAVERRSC